MRRQRAYRVVAAVCLTAGVTMAALSVIAALWGQPLPAVAAGLCAGVLVVPGLIFLNQAYRLFLRHAALAHVSGIVERDGAVTVTSLSKDLEIPEADARKILEQAAREGYVEGTFEGDARFISHVAVRCAQCGKLHPKRTEAPYCDACGAALPSR